VSAAVFVLVGAILLIGNHTISEYLRSGRWLYTLQGIVVVDLKGAGDQWSYDDLTLDLFLQDRPAWVQGPGWGQWQECEFSTEHFSAEMHLSSIANDGEAVNAGWAIDAVTFPQWPNSSHGYVTVATHMGARDSDGWLYRIGYTVHLYGSPVWKQYNEGE
jgi:hypothetical protein